MMGLKELYAERKPVVERVDLPADAGEWFVRELDAAELTRFHVRYDALKTKGKELLWFVCLAACEPDGKRVFEDADMEGVLLKVPGWVITEVWATGGKLNRLTKAGQEEAEKNSEPTPTGSSS